MKIINLLLLIGLLACSKVTVEPTANNDTNGSLIGKWNPAYQQQNKNANGTWSAWVPINTFVALPTIEYTADKKILLDGKTPGPCQYTTYAISGNNKLVLGDYQNSNVADCIKPESEYLFTIQKDTLVLEYTNIRTKLFRVK